MILGRSTLVVGISIVVLAYIYVWMSRPDIAQQMTVNLFKIIGVIGKVVYAIIVALAKLFSRMSITAIMIVAVIATVLALFLSAKHQAHCDCWPVNGEEYSPKSGAFCLNVSDSPPAICGQKYSSFEDCSVVHNNIAACET